jgi:hypothetical protein
LHPSLYPAGSAPGEAGWAATACADVLDVRDAACKDVAYQGDVGGSDVVSGPIRTNDRNLVVCGNPRFTDSVETTGPGSWRPKSETGCTGSVPTFTVGASVSPALPLPTSRSFAVATELAPPAFRFCGDATIVVAGDVLDVTSTSSGSCDGDHRGATASDLRFPDTGVIYVSGTATVSGLVDGQLTVFAGGDIVVPADLTYADAGSQSDDVVGLLARNHIRISGYDAQRDRTVHGALLAAEGTIYAEAWSSGAVAGAAPTLHVRGSLTSEYRGVFGGYSSYDGTTVSGYRKDFVYDARLRSIQPPYFLEPVSSSWQRVDLTEVHAGAPGVDTGGA